MTILRLVDLHAVTRLPFADASAVTYAPNSSLLAIGREGGLTVRHEAGGLRHVVTGRNYQHLAFSPNERSIACGTYGGLVDVLDVASMHVTVSLGVVGDAWVVFTPDGRFKSSGEVKERFGHAIGLVRYEPGDLDAWLDTPLRVPENQPLIEP